MKFGTFLILFLVCVSYVKGKSVDKDCSEESLEKLNFYDFLEKSDECKDETRTLFKKKYSKIAIEVEGELVSDGEEAIEENQEKECIIVRNIDVIKKILNNFGDLIHEFGINFESIDENNGHEIIKHINSLENLDSFQMMSLFNCKGTILDEWKNAFPNVETFGFSSDMKNKLEIKDDHKKLYELLPELKHLAFEYTRVTDWKFIGNKYPNLNLFGVELPPSKDQERPDESHVLSLLKNSRKVEGLFVENTNLKLLKGVNDILPELQNLRIISLSKDYSDDKIKSVEFKNVKYLTIESNEIHEKITFNGPEGITLSVLPKFSDKWYEFISKQITNCSAVNTFEFTTGLLSKDQLFNFTDHLPHLTNIKIVTESTFKANEIQDFVESNKDLKSLILEIQMEESEQKRIIGKFDIRWTVAVLQMGVKGSVQVTITRVEPSTGSSATHSIQLLIISLATTLIKSFGMNF